MPIWKIIICVKVISFVATVVAVRSNNKFLDQQKNHCLILRDCAAKSIFSTNLNFKINSKPHNLRNIRGRSGTMAEALKSVHIRR